MNKIGLLLEELVYQYRRYKQRKKNGLKRDSFIKNLYYKITRKISNIIQKIKIRLGIIKVHHVNTDKDDLLKAMLEAKSGDIIMVRGDEPLKDIKDE